MGYTGYYSSVSHQRHCFTAPIASSFLFGGVLSAVYIMQGAHPSSALFGRSVGFIYMYNALQCPMEALHGRRSLAHNALASGGLGAAAVATGRAGIPFLEGSFFWRYPAVKPPVAAAGVYGFMGLAAGMLSGKAL